MLNKPDLIHPLYPKLTLLMCHISGDPLKIEGFRNELYQSSYHRGEQVRKDIMYLTSTNGVDTVVQGNWISFQQL